MARVAGTAGSVYISSNIAGVRSWSIDHTYNILDGKAYDDSGAPHPVAGGYDWSGSFDCLKDGAPQAVDGSTISIELRESQTSTQKWTGSAILSGRHPSVAHDGLATITYDFVGSGALTAPTA